MRPEGGGRVMCTIESRPPDGRERVRFYDSQEGRERYVFLYRLTAVAHGKLDSLADRRHIHHINGVPWDDRPENLEAVEPADHPKDENGWNR